MGIIERGTHPESANEVRFAVGHDVWLTDRPTALRHHGEFTKACRQEDADGAIEIASVLLINDFLEARDAAFSAVPVEYLDLLGLLSDDDSEIEVEFAAAGRTSDFT